MPQDLSTVAGVAGRDHWQERERAGYSHRSHRRSESAEGEIGHWVRTAALLAPVVVSEFVKDPEQKLRFIRIASVAAAVLSEGMHTHKTFRDRERDRQALEACEAACAAL